MSDLSKRHPNWKLSDWRNLACLHAESIERLEAEVTKLLGQLPDGMKDCTIIVEECPKGHAMMRGTNWAKHDCWWCEIQRLQSENARLREKLREIAELVGASELCDAAQMAGEALAAVQEQTDD